MLKQLRLVSVTLLIALLSAFALVPASASAAPVTQAASPFAGHSLTGTFAGQNVRVVLESIVYDAATGVLEVSGEVFNAAGESLGEFANVPVTLPQQQPGAACQILHLEIGPLDLNLLGLRVQTNRIVVDITAVPGPGNLLGNLLCGIAGLLDDDVLNLNALLGLLNQLNGLLPNLGALPGTATGTVSGITANVVRFINQNGQLAAVIELRNAAGELIDTVTDVIEPNQASCTILDLTIGPLDLNLLGLRIQTNEIHILITAQPGPGNLLGNLLCGIARLLDLGNENGLAALLNRLIRLFR